MAGVITSLGKFLLDFCVNFLRWITCVFIIPVMTFLAMTHLACCGWDACVKPRHKGGEDKWGDCSAPHAIPYTLRPFQNMPKTWWGSLHHSYKVYRHSMFVWTAHPSLSVVQDCGMEGSVWDWSYMPNRGPLNWHIVWPWKGHSCVWEPVLINRFLNWWGDVCVLFAQLLCGWPHSQVVYKFTLAYM